ncbi:heat shock 70 kDa protein 12A-like [Mya arenaria]|uniref:heat shock 70 kDa protein 12A-like n=1 Tax=Mya arenaria TaxID=6604 RepID=UPI0022E0335E|nr:heat shock 70 kDa protein 12A-like [Mya arenaria]
MGFWAKKIHCLHLKKDVTVEDICGKRMKAFPLFAMSINFLREHLLEMVTKQMIGIEETDILYVLTVPAIWEDNAKKCMRDAAVALALEPECASIWCETLGMDIKGAESIQGAQYMVVDLGEKRIFDTVKTKHFIVRVSASLRKLAKKHSKQSLEDRIAALDIQENSITPKACDKLKIVGTIIQSWFKRPIDMLIQHIRSFLAEAKMKRVQTVVLVGGFGESPYVQERIKNEIPAVRMIVPEDAGLAVLNGAVRFGHNPAIVCSRIMKYTYGTKVFSEFDEKKHPCDKKVWKNGGWWVPNCFNVYARVNEEVRVEDQVTMIGTPYSKVSLTPVYRTIQENPEYVTDPGCELIGTVRLENSIDIPFEEQDIEDTFVFGDTELLVKTKNMATGKEAFMTFECFK